MLLTTSTITRNYSILYALIGTVAATVAAVSITAVVQATATAALQRAAATTILTKRRKLGSNNKSKKEQKTKTTSDNKGYKNTTTHHDHSCDGMKPISDQNQQHQSHTICNRSNKLSSTVGSAIPQATTATNSDNSNNTNTNSNSSAYENLIGNTPLILLNNLSKIVQRKIYIKMECCNPSGTGKDRAAYNMIQTAVTTYHSSSKKNTTQKPSVARTKTTLETNTAANGNSKNTNTAIDHQLSTDEILFRPLIEQAMKVRQQQRQAFVSVDNSNNDSIEGTNLNNDINTSTSTCPSILIVEGSSGSTGIAVGTYCNVMNYGCIIVIPDDQAMEKQISLQSLGCIVYKVSTASISNPNHYVNVAKRIVLVANNTNSNNNNVHAIFLNQFENIENFNIHYKQTGYEIWNQCIYDNNEKTIDAFVMSAGTGGTIAGVGKYLKEQKQKQKQRLLQQQKKKKKKQQFDNGIDNENDILIVLADCIGSSLHGKIQYGIAYSNEQCERTIKRHRYDSIVEGIGLDRITSNFTIGIPYIDTSICVTDQEAIDLAHYILQIEGLFIGSSTAINLVATAKTAYQLPIDSIVVTIFCDSGYRHLTRFWNEQFITSHNLLWPPFDKEGYRIPQCLQSIQGTWK